MICDVGQHRNQETQVHGVGFDTFQSVNGMNHSLHSGINVGVCAYLEESACT